MTTNEGNLLIERFMTEELDVLERDLLKAGTVECLRHYQTSWDSLMPVYREICNLYGPEIPEGEIIQTPEMDDWSDRIGEITCAILDVDIEDVWQEIVNFIEYYNNKNQQK